jgi:hypothetical protein
VTLVTSASGLSSGSSATIDGQSPFCPIIRLNARVNRDKRERESSRVVSCPTNAHTSCPLTARPARPSRRALQRVYSMRLDKGDPVGTDAGGAGPASPRMLLHTCTVTSHACVLLERVKLACPNWSVPLDDDTTTQSDPLCDLRCLDLRVRSISKSRGCHRPPECGGDNSRYASGGSPRMLRFRASANAQYRQAGHAGGSRESCDRPHTDDPFVTHLDLHGPEPTRPWCASQRGLPGS